MKLELTEADPPELHAFVRQQRLRNLAPATIDWRTWFLRRFAAFLDRPLAFASTADLRAFVASRRDRLSENSQVSEIRALKAFYAALLEEGLVDTNPADGIQGWRVPLTRRPISLERVRELLVEAERVERPATPNRLALAQRDRALFELLFATGMRASEVVATQVVDLDLTEGSVLVRRAKRGRSRRIPLPAPAVGALRRYLDEGRATLRGGAEDPGGVFLTRTGDALERPGLIELVRRVSKRAGAPIHSHVFRRTLATELVRAGTCLPAVQKILGHAHLTTTAYYVEVGVHEMRAALEALDRARPASHHGAALLDNSLRLQSRLFNDWQAAAA